MSTYRSARPRNVRNVQKHAATSRLAPMMHRAGLLTGTSVLALALAIHSAHARPLGGAAMMSAPSIASDAATLAAQQAAAAANQSSSALARATQAIQAMQAAQAAARTAAQARQTSTSAPAGIPNGLAVGGLNPNRAAGWTNANAPTQAVGADGQTNVTIQQTNTQAILNWTTFNVGARTTLTFDQQGNANWVALNRVAAGAAPSQILGQIKADGSVYIINQNGIIFGGGSQINVGTLIASTAGITDTQFTANGIYSTLSGGTYNPSFTAAGGNVIVEQGALITTNAPASATSGGGFVLMMGTAVDNAGTITTPGGQTMLAAGDNFILRPGYGTAANQFSSTRGNEIAPVINAGSASGAVENSGLVFSQQGDITLAGHAIVQDGILLSTTSVNQRGTIHLLNAATDSTGSVTLTGNSMALIMPELSSTDTALDAQRDALIAASGPNQLATGQFNDLSTLADRKDQSRVEIVSGGLVNFEYGSLTMAQGGQVAVSAGQRVFVATGATIDVSGVQGVALPMSDNEIQVNIQGNELRDSPANRDSNVLQNDTVWVDVRDLTFVPAGTGGYATDRYYTPGGLLEVGGYLSNTAHTIGEWSAVGGTITLSAPEVVTQQGSTLNISGGSVSYAGGYIYATNLRGADGRIYSVDNAPADMQFIALAGDFVRDHAHWGVTEVWASPFGKGSTSRRWEDGYTVGRDAGQLNISAPTAVLEGDVVADVITGQRQTDSRPAGVTDGYKLSQDTAPLAGRLAIGQFTAAGLTGAFNTSVVFGSNGSNVATAMSAGDALPSAAANTVYLSAPDINKENLGGVSVVTKGSIDVDAPLSFALGAQVRLIAPNVDIAANITAPSGSVTVSNIVQFGDASTASLLTPLSGAVLLTLEQGATIDASGLWVNQLLDPADTNLAFIGGGNVTFDSSQGATLKAGSAIDVSSGGAILANAKTMGGKGGSINLTTNDIRAGGALSNAALVLASDLRGYGVTGGGTLTIVASSVLVGDNVAPTAPGQLVLPSTFFNKGFTNYDITGIASVTVAANTDVDVTEPVYQFTAQSFGVASGPDASAALAVWTPPLYLANQRTAVLTQRAGASLALRATAQVGTAAGILVDHGATISVDPLQSVHIETANQITVDGTITAPGGTIALVNDTTSSTSPNTAALIPGQSIWLGDDSRLDVSASAAIALDSAGRPFGNVANGGSIFVGTDQTAVGAASNAFIVIRPGAVLDASGASATMDLAAGTKAASQLVDLASNGGSIALASNNGLYIDGTLRAAAGGAGASGGSLSVTLGTTAPPVIFGPVVPDTERVARVITISQSYVPSGLADSAAPGQADPSLAAGNARLSADRIMAGGFDNVSLYARDIFSFQGPVSLNVGGSISLYRGILSSADATSNVTLSAPYVLLNGNNIGTDPVAYINGSSTLVRPSTQTSTATFTIDADLIDLQNDIRSGVHASITKLNGSVQTVDAAGFGNIDLVSQGDIRFGTSTLFAPANLTLTAAQIYPMSGIAAVVTAVNVLTVQRISGDIPDLPYSVLGQLTLNGATVNQDGIVRAPFGRIALNATGSLDLLPGSITSASADGLVIPYGGTTDGVTYNYNGASLIFPNGLTGSFVSGVQLGGASVNVAHGATLDLSGGGDLAGSGFISGRGGSVDVLTTALANANPTNKFSSASDAVYAIVPSYHGAYAPVDAAAGTAPGIGQQVTIPAGVPGLPAGTYTLMPARYALLPGAYRVEIGKTSTAQIFSAGNAANGTYLVSGTRSTANTDVRSALPTELIVTPGTAVRAYSQYDEATYSQFAIAQAATLSQITPALPADAKTLQLAFSASNGSSAGALSFAGTTLFTPAAGGQGGTATVQSNGSPIEIYAIAPTAGFNGVSVRAADLDAIDATRMIIGGTLGTDSRSLIQFNGTTVSVTVRDGAVLTGPEIFLVADSNGVAGTAGSITLEAGAQIVTMGQGNVPFDSNNGLLYDGNGHTVVAVSNGWLNFLPPKQTGSVSGPINLGACSATSCTDNTILSSGGTILFSTAAGVQFGANVQYGARFLTFAVPTVNIGSGSALASANVPNGLTFNQDFLDAVLNGNSVAGAPKLEQLTLAASQSINFFGTVDLNTIDPATGHSVLQLNLDTPAIYGYGGASDVATITTGTLVWNGLLSGTGVGSFGSAAPGPVMQNGPGSGSGTFNIVASNIVFGFADTDQAHNDAALSRLMVGFSTVNMTASQSITANNKGSLSVYQSQGDYVEGTGYTYTGGNLNLVTPLLTGAGGSVNSITAGGTLVISAPAGSTPAAVGGDALGAELDLTATTITQGGTIALPSGRLTMTASGDIVLNANSHIDLAGRAVTLIDTTEYSWGGDVVLTSTGGNVIQQAGAIIDVSAANNNAGTVTVEALAVGAGQVNLAGTINGSSTGVYDAGTNSLVPYNTGSIDIGAQTIVDFTGLNERLTASGVTGSRSFDIKQGNLVIGNEIQANVVDISVDGGSLTVNGTINASGVQVGSIRLSAMGDLVINGTLDAHGTGLVFDNYGQIIDGSNRATIDLTTQQGTLVLASGARFDVRAGTGIAGGSQPFQNDGIDRGTVELSAPRLGSATSGDIAISAGGPLTIQGATSIAVNGFWTYTDAPLASAPDATGNTPQVITQAYLDLINSRDTIPFMTNALANADLMGRLAGLTAYSNAFHLRPGIQITNATPNGDLTIQGDLDFSRYRYASLNPNSQQTAIYGSGEPGTVIIRAGGNLNIYGSITDGFGQPVATPDDNGWILIPPSSAGLGFIPSAATEPFGFDVVVPISVTLAAGTTFGKALNFAIPVGSSLLNGNQVIPTTVTLQNDFVVPAGGFVASATIQMPNGQTFLKGQTVPGGTVLAASTTLAAGTVMPANFTIAAMIWPAGASMSVFAVGHSVLAQDTAIPVGSVLPSGTVVNGFVTTDANGNPETILGLPTRQTASQNWAVAPMLAPGSLSWNISLVAGADLGSADSRGLQSKSVLAAANSGNLILGDQHYTVQMWTFNFDGSTCNPADVAACGDPSTYPFSYLDYYAAPVFSVIRTGTGDLSLLAGNNFIQHSLYGIYTAGTQAATVDPSYQTARGAFYNFGFTPGDTTVLGSFFSDPGTPDQYYAGSLADYQAYYPVHGGNVLLSAQGNIATASLGATALNFSNSGSSEGLADSGNVGNWLWRQGGDVVNQPTAWWINFGTYAQPPSAGEFLSIPPTVIGFTGVGALGGGNVAVVSGGEIGSSAAIGTGPSGGLVLNVLNVAVASTGRVALGATTPVLTGGGDLSIKSAGGFFGDTLTDVRGNINVDASSIGTVSLSYTGIPGDPRAPDLLAPTSATSTGGPTIVIGDGHATLDTRGDLVVAGSGDPGRVVQQNSTPFDFNGFDGTQVTSNLGGNSFFTLWTAGSSIDLFSAGGNLTPSLQVGSGDAPPTLRAIAADGNIYFPINLDTNHSDILELAPSPIGQLQLLAGGSIYANGFNVAMSGADPAGLPTPFHPAFTGLTVFNQTVSNGNPALNLGAAGTSLFVFELDTPTTALHAGDDNLILFYANGDIVSLQTGDSLSGAESAAKAVRIIAGRDIVGSGGLIVQNGANDVSTISAGRDIFFANFDIAGSGLLQVTAGRNVYQAAQGSLHSIGPLPKIDPNPGRTDGTSIVVTAGAGANGPDYADFAKLYLDPANLADPSKPLADQPGKVVKNYDDELLTWVESTQSATFKAWLAQHTGQDNPVGAYAFFQTLGFAEQGIFLRQVYFAELAASGREFNAVDGPRQQSYLRGRDAIAALFPDQAADGSAITYKGDVTLFGSSGIHTDAGGSVQVLTPGGATLVGVEGTVPPATAGLITQGVGDIDVYSQGSVLLGLSRVMTTFGGNIVMWSAEGDINAGRGSKTTPVFTPPQRTYDIYGNVTLSPQAPATGAGIATLNPIPSVQPGNIDLIAPLGTIDVGEAGIRASGNVNLAALQIVNAANIQAQGSVTGVPVVQAPNVTTALTATNATAATQQVGLPATTNNNDTPSIVIVEFLGFGGGDGSTAPVQDDGPRNPKRDQRSYDPDSAVQYVGAGTLTDEQRQRLITAGKL